MLGAINHFPNNPLLVIDIGSAITFDVIDKNGLHHGGLIMPGIKALRGSFEKFKTSDLSLHLKSLANNTDDAWRFGTHAMMVSAINYQIESGPNTVLHLRKPRLKVRADTPPPESTLCTLVPNHHLLRCWPLKRGRFGGLDIFLVRSDYRILL